MLRSPSFLHRQVQVGSSSSAAGAVVKTEVLPSLPTTVPTTVVRHLRGDSQWFVPSTDRNGVFLCFLTGLMAGVVFNPKAKLMKWISCGSNRVSEGEAEGVLQITDNPLMPKCYRVADLDFDVKGKFFFASDQPEVPLTYASYLLLLPNGKAKVGWE